MALNWSLLVVLVGICRLTVSAHELQMNLPQPTAADTLIAYKQLVEADSLKSKGKYNQAIDFTLRAQRLYQSTGYPDRVLYCLVKRARIQDAAGQQKQRLFTLQQAQNYPSSHPTIALRGLKADADMQFAEVYIALGKSDSVAYYINRAATVFSTLKQWQQLTYCDILRAVNEYYSKNFKNMELRLASALQIARKRLPITNEVYSVIYQLQGVLFDAIGDYEKAIFAAQNGLHAKLSTPRLSSLDSSFVVSLYNNIGAIYYEKRDFDRTIDYYNQALRFALGQKSTSFAMLLNIHQNMALAYQKQGRSDMAMEHFRRSLEYSKDASPQKIAVIYFNLCAYFIEKKYSILALQYLRKGKALQQNTQQGIEIYYLQKANYQTLLNQPSKAIVTYQAGLRAAELNKNIAAETLIRQRLAAVYLAEGKYQKALQQVDQGLERSYPVNRNRSDYSVLVNQVGDRIALVELLRQKGEILQKLASTATTVLARQQQLQTVHSLNQTISTLLDTIRISYPWEKAKYSLGQKASPFYKAAMEVALQLHQLTGKESFLNNAFGYAEKNRAAVLQETIVDIRVRQNAGIIDKFWDNEKRLHINLNFYTEKLFAATVAKDSSRIMRYQQYLFENRRKLEALTTNFRRAHPAYNQLRHSIQPTTLRAIQAKLATPQATFIEYAEGVNDLYAFCITPKVKRIVRVGKNETIEQQVDDLRNSLTNYSLISESSTSAYKLFTQSAYQLYASLIKQVLPKQNTFPKRLILVPTGILSYVPFDNLLDSIPTRSSMFAYAELPYLLRKSAISYAYSATLFADTSSTKSSVSGGLLAFAPTYSADNQTSVQNAVTLSSTETSLIETQHEVKRIAQYFKGQIYIEKAATKRQFLKLAEGYDLIHVAMHSTVDQQNPNLNALIFAPEEQRGNNRLAAYEVANLGLNARMTVLSGCETGYGAYQAGEGVLSLARSFMLAGSQSVVMSLWKAEDRANAKIMNQFYQGLAAGLTKDEALRQSKLTYLMQSDALTGHPLFWSGIMIIGDSAQLVETLSVYNWWLLGIGLVVIVGAIILFGLKTRLLKLVLITR